MDGKNLALDAIRKKLVGKRLSYPEIYAIMDEIAKDKLGDILTTYFVASGYSEGFNSEEMYYLTKAMVETGEHLDFKGVVADKHSIGGVPGTRASLIIIPLIAAAGFKIPKSSSRAITTPAGTADCMEVLSSVTFTKDEIYEIVKKTNACIVWGGSFKIAPADDEIIKIEEPLVFESFDKIVVSVMAKKVAFGATHVIIDLPYGRTVKLHRAEEAEVLKRKFVSLGKKFNIRVTAFIHKIEEPAGRGIGPLLEARDALKVLEQTEDRPPALEELAIDIAGQLLDLCLEDANKEIKETFAKKYKNAKEWATDLIVSGVALSKLKEIIKAQKGDENITSEKLHPAKYSKVIKADSFGKIKDVSNKNITTIAKILGAPKDHKAGLILNKRIGDSVEDSEELFTLYSTKEYHLKEAIDTLELFPIYKISK